MALIICPECNKEISDTVNKCPHCGYKIQKVKLPKTEEEKKKIAKRAGIIIAAVVALFIIYLIASPRTVSWCCIHRTNSATCTQPQTCHRCEKTWGEAKGHTWIDATCTESKYCSICKITEGNALGHSWVAATCTEPKTCSDCGLTEGNPNNHKYAPATCETAPTCKNCGVTSGKKLGHNISEYICSRCKESFVERKDVPNILDITSATYEVNYVGGIDQYFTFKNKSETKTINYITMKIQFENALHDVLYDEITRLDYATLVYTGPLKPGKSSGSIYWRACFYNSTFGGPINFVEIKIEYSDGTTLILNDFVANEVVVAWR